MKRIFKLTPLMLLGLLILWVIGLPILHWLRRIFSIPYWLFALIWLGPALSLSASYLISSSKLKTWLHRLGECWFGVFIYLSLAFLLEAFILCIASVAGANVTARQHIVSGWLALAAFVLCYLWGVFNAMHIRTKRLHIDLPLPHEIKLVLLSDLHLGFFTGPKMLPRICKAILQEHPQAVLLAGDNFDMEYEALRDPQLQQTALAGLCAQVPVWAVDGNHDLLVEDARKEAFLKDCGVRLLRDESDDLYGLTLLGRRDVTDERRKGPEQVYPALAGRHPLVVLDHNPSGFREAWTHGADLVLSGHSHGGQTFPGNLIQRMFMSHPIYGHYQQGRKHLVVTSGAGFWGPPLRVGVNNEIVLLSLGSSETAK